MQIVIEKLERIKINDTSIFLDGEFVMNWIFILLLLLWVPNKSEKITINQLKMMQNDAKNVKEIK